MITATPSFLEVRNLRHCYIQPDNSRIQALSLDHLSASKGEAIAVVGPSGSGKTTLLHILAAMIRPTGGEVLFGGRDIFAPRQSGALWRATSVGFIFQEMNLMPDFSALENVLLAAEISNVPGPAAMERANSLLRRLDLWNQRDRRPAELSLGEQQRAAVARAVVHSPSVILADEPTASLDAENAGIVMNILTELCAESQTLLIIATHDEAVKKRFERVVRLQRPQDQSLGAPPQTPQGASPLTPFKFFCLHPSGENKKIMGAQCACSLPGSGGARDFDPRPEMKFRTEIRIALRHLRSRPFQTVSAAAVLALSSALAVILFLLAQGARDGLIRAVEPFDLIVGAKGSPYQLVLNTVMLRDVPIGNIKWSDHIALSDDVRTDFSVPLAFGDNYRGYPVIGTGDDILRIRRGASERRWLEVAEGRWFEDKFEAVLGAQTAAESKLRIGDNFRTSHGLVRGDAHEALFKVVGVAAKVFGPYDRAIFVNIESIWENHAHGNRDEHDDGDAHGNDEDKEVTAVLVRPASYPDAYRLAVSFQNDAGKQLVFPAQTAARLFSLLGSGERFMSVIVYSVAVCSLFTTMLVLYWSNRDKRREKALLSALGTPRGALVVISWMEGTFTLAIGTLAGELLGRAGAYTAYRFLGETAAIDISVPMTFYEAAVPAVMLIAGSLGALIMALGEKTGDGALLKRA